MPNTPNPLTDSDIKKILAEWETPVFFTGPYSKLEPQTQVAVLGVFSAILAQAIYFASIDRADEVQPRIERVEMAAELNTSPQFSTLLTLARLYLEALVETPSEPLYELRKENIGKAIIRKETTT